MSAIWKKPEVPDMSQALKGIYEEKKIRKGSKGKSTILTGPMGLQDEATYRKTLLGE